MQRKSRIYVFKENTVFLILDPEVFKRSEQGYKFIRLKYWDGYHWIARFLKKDDTDWIALTENRIKELIMYRAIRFANPFERFESALWEKRNVEI
jgi:hypothetical protein